MLTLVWLASSGRHHQLCLLGVMGVVVGVLGTAIPFASKVVIDSVLAGELSSLGTTVVALALIATTLSVIRAGHLYYAQHLVQIVTYDLRHSLYDRLLKLSLAFHNRSSIGDLLARLTSDIGRFGDTVGTLVTQCVSAATLLLLSLAVMIYLSPVLAPLVLVLSAPQVMIVCRQLGVISEVEETCRQALIHDDINSLPVG